MQEPQRHVSNLLKDLSHHWQLTSSEKNRLDLSGDGRCTLTTQNGLDLTIEVPQDLGLIVIYVKVGSKQLCDDDIMESLLTDNISWSKLKLAHYGLDAVTGDIYIRYFYPVEHLNAESLNNLLVNMVGCGSSARESLISKQNNSKPFDGGSNRHHQNSHSKYYPYKSYAGEFAPYCSLQAE